MSMKIPTPTKHVLYIIVSIKLFQKCLNKVETWATENGFIFSKTKTQCVHFCEIRGLHPDPVLNIYGSPIPVVEEAKCLGLLFNKKLSFIPHIKAL